MQLIHLSDQIHESSDVYVHIPHRLTEWLLLLEPEWMRLGSLGSALWSPLCFSETGIPFTLMGSGSIQHPPFWRNSVLNKSDLPTSGPRVHDGVMACHLSWRKSHLMVLPLPNLPCYDFVSAQYTFSYRWQSIGCGLPTCSEFGIYLFLRFRIGERQGTAPPSMSLCVEANRH